MKQLAKRLVLGLAHRNQLIKSVATYIVTSTSASKGKGIYGYLKERFMGNRQNSMNKKIVKLNIDCGNDYKEGWINMDNNSDNNIKKLDLNQDLKNGLPFEINSVDYIFKEHFLEHLNVAEGQAAIKDFIRVLKKEVS